MKIGVSLGKNVIVLDGIDYMWDTEDEIIDIAASCGLKGFVDPEQYIRCRDELVDEFEGNYSRVYDVLYQAGFLDTDDGYVYCWEDVAIKPLPPNVIPGNYPDFNSIAHGKFNTGGAYA